MSQICSYFLYSSNIPGIILIILSLGIQNSLTNLATEEKTTCGYESCKKGRPDMLNVHVIAHSHDDVGWLKTVDEYFYGDKNFIQEAGVQYILDTVTKELVFDPNKKFSYCESAFLSKWYNQQPEHIKEHFKRLVNNGQMTIIGGGWSQNDEATTHYSSIIDQMTFGFNFLENTFGECGRPHVGWQIDPFGHSKEMASLFAQMGFDGEFCGRWDFEDFEYRKARKEMEFIWQGSDNLGQSSQLLNVILPFVYWWPKELCFDPVCKSISPVVDDPESESYNVDSFAQIFLNATNQYSKMYKTNNVILTMGLDFTYQNADYTFKSIDKLLKYINELQNRGSKVNAFYSTPNCYLKALYDSNLTWTIKDDDLFPLGEQQDMYWTGYFTSRPAAKYQERYSNNFLQICKQMSAISNYFLHPEQTTFDKNVEKLREALGIMQHHDAITGTAKQRVANDYAKLLSSGVFRCQTSILNTYKQLMPLASEYSLPKMHFCHLLNASQCQITTFSKDFTVTIYNPLGYKIFTYIHVPVLPAYYRVLNHSGYEIENQISPISKAVERLPEHKISSQLELVFPVHVPPVGFKTFFVSRLTAEIPIMLNKETITIGSGKQDIVISNEYIKLTFDGKTGYLKTFDNLIENVEISMRQEFLYYKSESFEGHVSGAYLFRPSQNIIYPLGTKIASISVVRGPLVEEVHQTFNNWTSQVIRLRKNQAFAEFDWVVGPIPHGDFVGKEIISRFDTNLRSEGVFYTDANGREVAKRRRNRRKSWVKNITEPITSNYYPITSRIYIQDRGAELQFTVLTDRSQGGGSIVDGSIELMVHRRIFEDDSLGVSETLNEFGVDGKGLVVRGKHYVTLSTISSSARITRQLAQTLYMAPLLTFANNSMSREEWSEKYLPEFSLLYHLPPQVHLLSLELLSGHNAVLIRLEHFFELNEDPLLSQPVTVDLKNLFIMFIVTDAQEMTLGANKKLDELQRLKFRCYNNEENKDEYIEPISEDFKIKLIPMQIRTFFLTVKERSNLRTTY